MQVNPSGSSRKFKIVGLTTLTAGMLYASACSAVDIKHNIIGGTMGFVEGYAEDFWSAVVPGWDEILGGAQE